MPESANEHLDWLEREFRARPPAAVLDVGMGRGNYGWFLRNVVGYRGRLIGVEVWEPYVVGPDALAGANRDYYDEIVVADVRAYLARALALAPDTVLAFDVIEHFERAEGQEVLRGLQRAATRQVLVSVPIVPYEQGALHGNPHEVHLCNWQAREMSALGGELVHRGAITGLFRFSGGRVDRAVSLMLNTVRESEAAPGGVLESLADDLAAQDFTSVELVVVDGLHEHRWEVLLGRWPFRIVHVPPRQTAMVRDRRVAIAAYKNTGLAHARGELVVTVDDCARLDPQFLSRCWAAWHEEKLLLGALYADEHGEIVDSRLQYLAGDRTPSFDDPRLPPMHGFVAIPMQAALAVNGYDEMYDGSRGIEDQDMGIRLQKAGWRIVLDRGHVVRTLAHGAWSARIFGRSERTTYADALVKCCQTTLQNQWKTIHDDGRVRANEQAWTDEEWGRVAPRCFLLTDELRCGLNQHPCPYVGICSDREHPGLAALQAEPPVFDLGRLRYDCGIA